VVTIAREEVYLSLERRWTLEVVITFGEKVEKWK
jgi:hypothetical protein